MRVQHPTKRSNGSINAFGVLVAAAYADLSAHAYEARMSGKRLIRICSVTVALGASALGATLELSTAQHSQRLPVPLRGVALRTADSPRTAAPAWLAAASGPLTDAAPGRSAESIVRGFLSAERDRYRLDAADLDTLVVLGDSPGGGSGLRMLRVEQQVDGLPVFGSETRFVLDRQGRLWRSVGTLVPGVARAARRLDHAHLQSPAAALASLLAGDGTTLAEASIAVSPAQSDHFKLDAPAPAAGPASARLVWFASAPGRLVPAWSLIAPTIGDADWYALVDAESGAVLWRRNLREHASSHAARFSVYVQADGQTPADSPAPQSPSAATVGSGSQYPRIARTTVPMLSVQSIAASPNGWIDDCPGGADGCDTTRGNNADACLDRDATQNVCDSTLDVGGRPRGNPDSAARNRDFLGVAPRDFDYSPAPEPGDPNQGDAPTNADFQRGSVSQAFYLINWFHDRMYALGFDEASGNYQQLNLHGQGGLGGDRIVADIQNSGANGGSFTATPDGAGPGRMQVSLFDGPAPDRDGNIDADIVLHELTHGLSHRLIGNATGLLWDPARAMGEGWSDFYALALLNGSASDDPNGRYAFAGYATYRFGAVLTDNYFYGFRRFPYSTDNTINPLTWADIDAVTANDTDGAVAPSPLALGNSGALEVHNAGTVWALSLWEVRARVIADAAGANGNVAVGNETMLQLVTDALKLTPANPSFIDGRDALIAADCATHACAHEHSIWAGFADRGLGYGAIAPMNTGGRFARAHVGIGTSFVLPHLDLAAPMSDILIDDSGSGNGDGKLDPGESAWLTITLSNPWQAPTRAANAVVAMLSTSTPGLSISDASANYPDIAAGASASNPTDRFRVTLSSAANCGQRLQLELQTQSSLGSGSADFALRVGTPGGEGAPQTFSSSPNLAIPDNRADGISSSLTIAADLLIADIDLRIDSLTHPVTGQLSVMLRAPDGIGSDLIWRRGGLMSPNQGVGANLVGVTIDDDLPLAVVDDLNQSLATQAPFTGDWLPAWNSPFWDSYATTPAVSRDSIPQLQRHDGSSTLGTWTLQVADGNATASGTLDGWSLRVRPRSYACTPYLAPLVFSNGFE